MLAALMLLAGPAPDAKQTLLDVLDHYRSLKSFSMTIENEHSSGLYPGIYTQSLKWRNDGKFELLVTTPPRFTAEDRGQNAAPNYFANGVEVVSVYPDGQRSTGPLKPDANNSAGWEVSAGPILSFLQGTGAVATLKHPPEGMTITYRMGTTKSWGEMPVREILMKVDLGGVQGNARWFLAESKPQLVGIETEFPNQPKGTARFRNQVENPDLPVTLGTPPK